MNNVSVEKIQEGIDYLEGEFMKPLLSVGSELLENYKSLNSKLHSATIDQLIAEQQNKLDSLSSELERICAKTRSAMDDSRAVISQNVSNIDDSLGNVQ